MSEHKVAISVITINYNGGEGLERTIRSVAGQSFPGIEYIVIDGGSADGSIDIIRKYADKISYWVSEKDKGIYNAMNKGIQKATGDYLLFINSGDMLDGDHVIEELIKGTGTDYDLIYGDLRMTYQDGKTKVFAMPETVTIETMITGTLFHPVTLIKRELFQQYGLYDERLKIVSDWAFFLKIIAFGNVKQLHKPVIVANFFMDGISSQPENYEKILNEKKLIKSELFSDSLIAALDKYPEAIRFYNYPGMGSIRLLIRVLRKVKNTLKAGR